jgi:hypothetical protein
MHADGLAGLSRRSSPDFEVNVLQAGGSRDLFSLSSGLFKWHDGSLSQ